MLHIITHAHSGPITDVHYNPFYQSVLATTGFDSQIVIDSEPEAAIRLDSLASLPLNENNRMDCVK